MNNLWTYIQGLNLSRRNQAWLVEKLTEAHKHKAHNKSADDSTLMSKEEFLARVDNARKGTGKAFANVSELDMYIRNL